MPADTYVRYATDAAGVATVEFATPPHNSLSAAQLAALAGAFDEAARDPACRVVVLRAGGHRTFCAGASLDELLAVATEAEGTAFFEGFARVVNAMRRCPRLILGRIHGKAVGGGVGLAAACDLAFATRFAAVRLSELALGIGPFVIAPAVARKVGVAALADLSLRPAEFLGAASAKTAGLYTEVLDDAEALDRAVAAKAGELAGYGAAASAAWKRALWAGTDDWDDLLARRAALSGRLVTLPPAREALAVLRGSR